MSEYLSHIPPVVESEDGEILPPNVSKEDYLGNNPPADFRFEGDTYIGDVPKGEGLSEGDRLYRKAERIAELEKLRRERREKSAANQQAIGILNDERPSDDNREMWNRIRNN